MTDGSENDPSDSLSGGPIDFDRLEVIRERLATDDRFTKIDEQPAFAPERLVCRYDQQFYPKHVRRARRQRPRARWRGACQ